MLYIVLTTMLLYLIHLFLPKVLTHKINNDFSNIDKLVNSNPNVPSHVIRINNATENLKESLPIFFACAVLSIVIGVNSIPYAISWLLFRIAYLILYIFNLNPYRTIVWLGSVICLILMGLNLII